MDVFKPMVWSTLVHEYDLDGKRLLPWEGWATPFGGAWCVVRAGTTSLLHKHDEQEMFIAVAGEAQVRVGDAVYAAKMGDVIAIPPKSEHHVINDKAEDFHFYTVWWDHGSCDEYMRNGRRNSNG